MFNLQSHRCAQMSRLASAFLRRTSSTLSNRSVFQSNQVRSGTVAGICERPNHRWPSFRRFVSGSASSPSLSIWRRRKEMTKEGLIVAKDLKRLHSNPVRLDRYIRTNIARLLKSDLVAVLAELQRQDQVFLCMKLYDVVRREIWYRPDMFFYRDMLMMLARNKKVDEAKQVWEDLKGEEVLFDQHTFGDLVRAFLDTGLPSEAMDIYDEMRQSSDPPLSLPFRVILKGLIPYPELREKVKDDFLELFPDMIVYDAPEDLFDDDDDDQQR